MPAQEISEQNFFGKAPINILFIRPSDEECTYEIDKTFTKHTTDVLWPPDAASPRNFFPSFPQPPIWRLHQDPYCSGEWAYCANYILDDLQIDEIWMAALVMPLNAESTRCLDGQYVSCPIPGIVKTILGVPFIYLLDGDTSCPYTLSCIPHWHCFVHLYTYKDCPEIPDALVHLAKLT